jgi:hypothetical protein
MCHDPAFLVWCQGQGFDLGARRSPRWIRQTWGQWRCMADPLHWVRPVAKFVGQCMGIGRRHIVITDVRKPIELRHLVANGGKLLRVIRPGHIEPMSLATAAHETETSARALIAADEIHNDGTFAHLGNEIERVVGKHWGAEALPHRRNGSTVAA